MSGNAARNRRVRKPLNHSQRWYLKLLLLMPDHLHMLIGVAGDAPLSSPLPEITKS
jgi:REP element-mobilizing transposase RayT